MKPFNKLKTMLPLALTCLWGVTSQAQSVIGQWDFTAGNLAPSVGTNSLGYIGSTAAGTQFGTTAALGLPSINGTNANVMAFPASDLSGGYYMPVATTNSEGGTLVNDYTIVMDVLFKTNGVVLPLVQTDEALLTPDADLVVDSSGGIGAPPGPYSGTILSNTWYRIAFTVNTTTLSKFINGQLVGTQPSGGKDGRLALTPQDAFPSDSAWLFQNSTLNGAAPGYVSSIQLWSTNLNPGQVAALGGPSAAKIPSSIPVVPSYIVSRSPAVNVTNALPSPNVSVVVNAGSSTIDSSTFATQLDGATIPSQVSFDGTNYSILGTASGYLPALSSHTAAVVFSDSVAGLHTNSWAFKVCKYQNVTLPAPIYLETFDEVTPGGIPAGWTVTNWTDVETPGLNLSDPNSDSYLNWVTVDLPTYTNAPGYSDTQTYTSPGFPTVSGNRRLEIPPIVENGVLLNSLATSNLFVAESDQRSDSQVQVAFTRDYDFTGQSNVYVSFHNINEQNQDNICSVEYSVDQGATWLPLLYMLDDGTTDNNGSDVITNATTHQVDAVLTFTTGHSDAAHSLPYGTYIGAAISQSLAPFIRPCRNDDTIQQKRIETFRLPLADNNSHVRLRFMQAGTGSWFFDIDNLGFYSIPTPVITEQPTPVAADFNGTGTFSVTALGDNLTYQWQHNSTNIDGATNSTYTINNAGTNDVGLYTVTISNSGGSAVSDAQLLTLVYTPVIDTAPVDQNIFVGVSASFSIQAHGGRPLSYQWLQNSNPIAGATNTTYTIYNAQTNQSGYYQVQVSNAFSTVVSKAAYLSVFSGSITSSMVAHFTFDNTYADATGRGNYCTNLPNTYANGPTNSPNFTNGFIGQAVHVYNNGTPSRAPSTNNFLTILGPDGGYPNDLKFGSDVGGNTASDFSVSFWTKIFEQNDDQAFISDKNWDSGSNPGWGIFTQGSGMKWNYRDNAENLVAGEGSTRRDSPGLGQQLLDGGWHHVTVTFARHSVASTYIDGVQVNVNPLGTDTATNILGSVDTDSIGFNVNIGQDGTGYYTDGGSVSHVNMLMDDLAIWRRVVTSNEVVGIFNAGLSGLAVDKATATSPGVAPKVQIQPVGTSALAGSTANFLVSPLGSPSLAIQWYQGTNALAGQTNETLSVTNVSALSAGGYTAVITNNYGAVTSSVATLTFLSVPSITKQPVNQTVSVGVPVTFTVGASGVGTLGYQWYLNSNSIPGAIGTNYTIANVTTNSAGFYYCMVTNAGGANNSASALLNVISGSLSNGVVAYLPFDKDYNDHSGNNNNGTPVGNVSLVPGRVGNALHFSSAPTNTVGTNFVTLGTNNASLMFGTNSFSVSFWVNYTNQADDSPFISNKDWNSSGNQGWGVFSQNGGNFSVNATGTSGTKQNVKLSTILRDGNWHHVAVSFWRGNYASVYADGKLVATSAMTFGGSVDPANMAVNIGQDGTGTYTDGTSAHIDALIDEVILWNRVISASEVSQLYTAGSLGGSALESPYITSTVYGGNSLTINWINGIAPFSVQKNTSLGNANWSTVTTTTNTTATIPVSGAAGYLRVLGTAQ